MNTTPFIYSITIIFLQLKISHFLQWKSLQLYIITTDCVFARVNSIAIITRWNEDRNWCRRRERERVSERHWMNIWQCQCQSWRKCIGWFVITLEMVKESAHTVLTLYRNMDKKTTMNTFISISISGIGIRAIRALRPRWIWTILYTHTHTFGCTTCVIKCNLKQ